MRMEQQVSRIIVRNLWELFVPSMPDLDLLYLYLYQVPSISTLL